MNSEKSDCFAAFVVGAMVLVLLCCGVVVLVYTGWFVFYCVVLSRCLVLWLVCGLVAWLWSHGLVLFGLFLYRVFRFCYLVLFCRGGRWGDV